MSNIIDDIKAVYERIKESGWKENPLLVPSSLEERAKTIAKDNNIPVIIEGVRGVWKKEEKKL